METIRGRKSLELDIDGLKKQLSGYNRLILDLGTGDGRYVHYLAKRDPGWFVVGLDSCRENLREYSRSNLQNMLFIIASVQALPCELNGLVSHMSINFPRGSLLESLLAGSSGLFGGLASLSRTVTSFDIRINSGALAEASWTLEIGAGQIYNNLIEFGWHVKTPALMDARALHSFQSTWARRLAFGRDPRAVVLSGWFSSPGHCIERQV